jgi:hypothetical protein
MANDRMKPVSIDDYIAGFPPEVCTSLPPTFGKMRSNSFSSCQQLAVDTKLRKDIRIVKAKWHVLGHLHGQFPTSHARRVATDTNYSRQHPRPSPAICSRLQIGRLAAPHTQACQNIDRPGHMHDAKLSGSLDCHFISRNLKLILRGVISRFSSHYFHFTG